MTEDPQAAPAADPIRVVIADDHVLYRRGLQMVVSQDDDIEIVGEAGDGKEAVDRTVELLPDVVLMDVRMPHTSGIEACQKIKSQVPSTKIIMLTMSDEESDLYEAVKAGANGYLLKDVPGEEIADGVRAVHNGDSLISPSMASKLLAEFALMSRRQGERPSAVGAPRLTERELEVLRLVARGLANKEIAHDLFISENTVKNHVRNILEKLQLHSRMEAAMYAVRENLLEPDE
ncbi:response regulator transcription factor [Phycicoccus sp. M110.8]|uniref:response regulator transcription factor n=1 Tax=unclassified Phycicoccus TaxID=2637926 RepID=UPI002866AD95|nr:MULTISPECIES: response regulator transcription factor [unclassified Phycicoccus]MDR6862212.1 two-component system NarL family response regulator [Phycicoccus sp. 3266]MDU0312651.1 response regulator transcription factor [Phycicoccus sp. M110.8]HET8769340.1 response regulator transcription factor [Pedococcus sp.]